ncbi:NAD(P)-binding protein [Exidia glandulosa HHB12029]|uniref:NAD(P)-binding protein n=1 Tax=Exidia glandulosa HHB12029 TaxID=1314781 RepID=A0A165EFM0_EXIGL|nr:NAD(P)-binding protein [Exidia glandulosa HHB12029]
MSSKIWLVTGANSGIGLALATYLLAQGCKVVATARNVEKLPSELREAKAVALDLSWSDERIKAAGVEAWDAYGHIDVVANNAGQGLHGPVELLRVADVVKLFQSNVFGQLSLIQALIPLMREHGSGTFFNFSSIAGIDGPVSFSAYNASKAAFESFTEALAKEIAPFGLRAYIVEPGFFPTNWFTSTEGTEDPTVKQLYPQAVGATSRLVAQHVKEGQMGDVEQLAARLYEVSEKPLKEEWIRIPLGPDCGEGILAKVELVRENVEGTREIWSSTDLSPEEVKARYGTA